MTEYFILHHADGIATNDKGWWLAFASLENLYNYAAAHHFTNPTAILVEIKSNRYVKP